MWAFLRRGKTATEYWTIVKVSRERRPNKTFGDLAEKIQYVASGEGVYVVHRNLSGLSLRVCLRLRVCNCVFSCTTVGVLCWL